MTTDEPRPTGPTGPATPAVGPGTPAADRIGRTIGEAAPTTAVDVPVRGLVAVGTGIWALALVLTLVVPALHEGDRSWWPWSCVTGIALGGFAWWYVGRGRGSAADA
ncbi:DUF2530 domain-containing protein [Oryzobacter telluris]|uniref:DUF2530 domain-containing protein n=1 Tax=Oryzobacter telluris TaxID=3149179 RepID=UPI00370D479E